MNFSVEEENLICMYHTSDRRRTMAQMRAAAFIGLAACFVSESCLRTEARGLRMFLSRFSFLSTSA